MLAICLTPISSGKCPFQVKRTRGLCNVLQRPPSEVFSVLLQASLKDSEEEGSLRGTYRSRFFSLPFPSRDFQLPYGTDVITRQETHCLHNLKRRKSEAKTQMSFMRIKNVKNAQKTSAK